MSAGLRRLWQLLVAVSALLTAAAQNAGAPPLVPALFVFGDSLVDNGNNNNLASLAKANYLPYGIDFAAGPTGRFCNGYTIVDELGTYVCSVPTSQCARESPQIHLQKTKRFIPSIVQSNSEDANLNVSELNSPRVSEFRLQRCAVLCSFIITSCDKQVLFCFHPVWYDQP